MTRLRHVEEREGVPTPSAARLESDAHDRAVADRDDVHVLAREIVAGRLRDGHRHRMTWLRHVDDLHSVVAAPVAPRTDVGEEALPPVIEEGDVGVGRATWQHEVTQDLEVVRWTPASRDPNHGARRRARAGRGRAGSDPWTTRCRDVRRPASRSPSTKTIETAAATFGTRMARPPFVPRCGLSPVAAGSPLAGP